MYVMWLSKRFCRWYCPQHFKMSWLLLKAVHWFTERMVQLRPSRIPRACLYKHLVPVVGYNFDKNCRVFHIPQEVVKWCWAWVSNRGCHGNFLLPGCHISLVLHHMISGRWSSVPYLQRHPITGWIFTWTTHWPVHWLKERWSNISRLKDGCQTTSMTNGDVKDVR